MKLGKTSLYFSLNARKNEFSGKTSLKNARKDRKRPDFMSFWGVFPKKIDEHSNLAHH
jgi:hypothetical protein